MPNDVKLRLFIAIDLPGDVRSAIAALQAEMKSRLSGVRWTRPEGMHLTLKFLGETPAGKVEGIGQALAAAASGRQPFGLSIGAPGSFGNRGRPRVLWLGFEGDLARLRELQTAVDADLAPLGYPRETREFSPHLTLARVPQPPEPQTGTAIEHIVNGAPPVGAQFQVREVLLMRSRLLPSGAVYDCLSTHPLA